MKRFLRFGIIVAMAVFALAVGIYTVTFAYAEGIVELEYNFDGDVITMPVADGTVLSYGLDWELDGEYAVGYVIEWRLGSVDGCAVEYPYTVSRENSSDGKIVFYGKPVPIDVVITVSAGDDTMTVVVKYGSCPTLPAKVFDCVVDGWYTDKEFENVYEPTVVTEPFTLYPLFKDRFVSVAIDGETTEVLYGSFLTIKDDTDTHKFIGYAQNDGEYFHGKITKPIELTSVYERVKFRVTVKNGEINNFYFSVGNTVNKEDLSCSGKRVCLDTEGKIDVRFPMELTDDIVLYIFDEEDGDNKAEDKEFFIFVSCKHATVSVKDAAKAGETVTAIISEIEDGYELKAIVVFCKGEQIIALRYDDAVRFIMPSGNVDITVTVEEKEDDTDSVSSSDDNSKVKLDKKEIIAIAITCTAILIGGIVFLVVKIRKNGSNKKRSPRGENDN